MAKKRRRRRRVQLTGAAARTARQIAGCRQELRKCLARGESTPGLAFKVCKRRHAKCLGLR